MFKHNFYYIIIYLICIYEILCTFLLFCIGSEKDCVSYPGKPFFLISLNNFYREYIFIILFLYCIKNRNIEQNIRISSFMELGETKQSAEYFISEHMVLRFIPINEVKTAEHNNMTLQPLYQGDGPMYIYVTSLLAILDF